MECNLHSNKENIPSFSPLKPPIAFDQLECIDLRVGIILAAQTVPKSKKLLQLTVDLGFDKRTILSGISLYYTPEQLIGKKVVVVANLQPAKLMGIESQGMLLAGSWSDKLELLQLADLPAGSAVY